MNFTHRFRQSIASIFWNWIFLVLSRLSSSLVNLPTYLNSDEQPPDVVIGALIRNKAAHNLILKRFPNTRLAQQLRGSIDDEAMTSTKNHKQQINENSSNVVKLKRKVSSLFKTKPLRPILKKPLSHKQNGHNIAEEETETLSPTQQPNPSLSMTADSSRMTTTSLMTAPASSSQTQYLNHLKVRKKSLTYRGAMLSIPKYRLRASSCPDIYWNSMVTIDMEVEDDNCFQRGLKCVNDYITGWKECMNPAFLVFALSNFILYAW